ncbi:MAG TPA: hypothetical protein VLW45_07305 [Pelomicrobium sp.]|nr:hypothetical protein [Pelomicrobium sp.]
MGWLRSVQVAVGAALGALALAAAAAQTVRVTVPAPEETIHDNRGNVSVAVALDSELKPGQALQPVLDGKPVGPLRRERVFELQGLDRGEHILEVRLVDEGGRVLAVSPPVRFYQWQASRLFPSRQ